MEVLSINNLTKVYNSYKGAKAVVALDGITLNVSKGEFIGIMGPSGSGKTTLLNIISGVDNCTSGEITLHDREMSKLSKDELALFRRKNIGYIFQDFNLLDSLTLKENISLPLILDKVKEDKIETRVKELMEFLEIYDLKDKYPYHISGGQKQRVAAARALANNPAIIYADEPTGNLDSKASNNIMNTLSKLNNNMDTTILMVTHDPFAASFCRRIVFIKDGQVKLEIYSDGDRKKFFEKILEVQGVIGGEV